MIDEYFALARERHAIYLRRKAGQPWPWTDDPILRDYRFCNVFRELDRTTAWFREHVRQPLRGTPEVLLATVVFRLFNRITTGEAIFQQTELFTAASAWAAFIASNNGKDGIKYLRQAILNVCKDGPYVTGSYIIKTPEGYSKLDGVLWIIEQFVKGSASIPGAGAGAMAFDWRDMAEILLTGESWKDVPGAVVGLQDATEWFEQFPFIGWFTAYELVSDLRHTDLLYHAPDINNWANPGPGATRGLNLIAGREWHRTPSKAQLLEEMQGLLELSRSAFQWPQPAPDDAVVGSRPFDYGLEWVGYDLKDHAERWGEWPPWEMREVEHWCCEYAKYWRAKNGGAKPRGRFRP